MRTMLAWIAVAACGGTPTPPAVLSKFATLPDFVPPSSSMAFDADDSLVMADGNTGLQRLRNGVFQLVPNTAQFAFGTSLGVDQDKSLLVVSNQNTEVARVVGDSVMQVGPFLPNAATAPVGTPAGRIYVRIQGSPMPSVRLDPGGTEWVPDNLDLERNLRGPDGTLFAIVNGTIVSFGADDTMTPIGDCTPFGGGVCGSIELAGFDAIGELFMGQPGATSIQVMSPGGAIRDVDLPGDLELVDVRAGALAVAMIADDPQRGKEQSLWIVESGDVFARVTTLASQQFAQPQLLVDHSGNPYVAFDAEIDIISTFSPD